MSRNLSVTEPHPSLPKSGGYIGSGRGGAGNIKKYRSEDVTSGSTATGPASRVPLTKHSKRSIPAGRGGAGNFVTKTDDEIFQFDEEMISKRHDRRAAPVYHIGRGGAGNLFYERPNAGAAAARKHSSDSSASDSDRNSASVANPARRGSTVLSIFSRRSS